MDYFSIILCDLLILEHSNDIAELNDTKQHLFDVVNNWICQKEETY